MIKINKSVNPKHLLELVKKAETEGERIIIESQGQGKVAIINYADFEHLEALEDAIDSELLRQAIAQSDGEFSTLEEVLAKRGLTTEDLISQEDE